MKKSESALRILHTIETRGPGGAEILLVNIANQLLKKGLRNYGFFIKDGWLRKTFYQAGIPFTYVPLKGRLNILFFVKLLRYVKSNSIDVVHAHELTMSFYASMLRPIFPRLRVICTIHGRHYHSETLLRRFVMRLVSKSSSLIAVSRDVKKIICDKCNIDPKLVTVIRNGVKIPEVSLRGDLRKELSLSNDTIMIGTVGRLHAVKGHKYLIDAAKVICKRWDNLCFVIAGDGQERERLQAYIDSNDLGRHFKLLGSRNDVPNILSSLDLFVLPSLSEGTSLALLEAMMVGLPVIATRVGENERLLSDIPGNICIPPKDVPALTEALLSWLNGNMLRVCLLQNRRRVIGKYSESYMVDQYMSLYRRDFR